MVAARATGLLKLLGLCVVAGMLLAAILFPMAGGIGWVTIQASDAADEISGDLVKVDPPQRTTILDRDGNPIAYLYEQDRELVRSEQISPFVKAAIVAVEDHRFYTHRGLDSQRSLKAVGGYVTGNAAGGGSTLTQQYVKNYLAYVVARNDAEMQEATEHSPARKLREARIALQLEQRLSKDDILARYLNVVPFGGKIYGISSAARTYFNTTPDKLTIDQAAFLAGLVNRPSALLRDQEAAIKRRNTVLDRMVETGFLKEDQQRVEEIKRLPLGLTSPLRTLPNDCANAGNGNVSGFFCAYVIDYLGRLGLSKDQLKRGGYTIKTTMDQKATDAAKQAAENQVPQDTNGIANVIAVVEPGSHRHPVRALAANRDFGNDAGKGQTSYRLPSDITKFGAGSIYKIFTAAAAMGSGIGIHDIIDVPQSYTSKVYKGSGNKPYSVNNANENAPSTQMSLQDALAHSPNTGFVILEERAGLDNVVDMAVRLGMRDSMRAVNKAGTTPDPTARSSELRVNQEQWVKQGKIGSFTLGVTVTSVLELANVGATLASNGTWCPPTPIDQVLDHDGTPVPLQEPSCDQAVDKALANSLAQALSQDTTKGTATAAAHEAGWDREMLGKTGTTQSHMSAGFLGATPQFAGAVLTFSDSNTPKPICDGARPRLCRSGNIYGGKVPARTWFEAMKPLHQDKPKLPLPPADPRYQ